MTAVRKEWDRFLAESRHTVGACRVNGCLQGEEAWAQVPAAGGRRPGPPAPAGQNSRVSSLMMAAWGSSRAEKACSAGLEGRQPEF